MNKINTRWTDDYLLLIAKDFNNPSEWRKKSGTSYLIAKKKGTEFFEKCCVHMQAYRKIWSDDMLLDDAKKYNGRHTWKKKSRSAHNAALKKGIDFFNQCCAHMRVYKKWTEKAIRLDACKYKRRIDWNRKSPSAYSASLKKGAAFHEECCWHMRFYKTKE